MSTKFTLTITADEDYLAPDQIDAAMARTLACLSHLDTAPTRKVVITLECKDDEAELHEDAIDAALSGRPVGIEVVLKTTRERHVARQVLAGISPMDKAGWN